MVSVHFTLNANEQVFTNGPKSLPKLEFLIILYYLMICSQTPYESSKLMNYLIITRVKNYTLHYNY